MPALRVLPLTGAGRRLSTHDALRWWAFVAIFLAHAGPTTTALAPNAHALAAFNPALLAVGNVAAQVFFTLAGYWVVGKLAAEKAQSGRVAVVRFWVGRARRLLPVYVVCLLIGFGLEPLLTAVRHLPYAEPARLAYYALGLANFDKLRIQPVSWVLAELWAIAVIGQFAGLAPLLVAAVPRRWLVGALSVVLLASLGFQVLHADERMVLKLHSAATFTDFAVGGLAALLGARSQVRSSPELQAPPWWGTWGVVVGLLALAPLRQFLLAAPATAPLARLAISGGIAVGLVLLSRIAPPNPGRGNGLWARMGQLSYGLYAFHTVALGVAAWAVRGLPPTVQPGAALVLVPLGGLALTLALAAASDRWVERPFQQS